MDLEGQIFDGMLKGGCVQDFKAAHLPPPANESQAPWRVRFMEELRNCQSNLNIPAGDVNHTLQGLYGRLKQDDAGDLVLQLCLWLISASQRKLGNAASPQTCIAVVQVVNAQPAYLFIHLCMFILSLLFCFTTLSLSSR